MVGFSREAFKAVQELVTRNLLYGRKTSHSQPDGENPSMEAGCLYFQSYHASPFPWLTTAAIGAKMSHHYVPVSLTALNVTVNKKDLWRFHHLPRE